MVDVISVLVVVFSVDVVVCVIGVAVVPCVSVAAVIGVVVDVHVIVVIMLSSHRHGCCRRICVFLSALMLSSYMCFLSAWMLSSYMCVFFIGMVVRVWYFCCRRSCCHFWAKIRTKTQKQMYLRPQNITIT